MSMETLFVPGHQTRSVNMLNLVTLHVSLLFSYHELKDPFMGLNYFLKKFMNHAGVFIKNGKVHELKL